MVDSAQFTCEHAQLFGQPAISTTLKQHLKFQLVDEDTALHCNVTEASSIGSTDEVHGSPWDRQDTYRREPARQHAGLEQARCLARMALQKGDLS